MNANGKNVIGIDFGSDSVRALIVNAASGETLGVGVAAYPRWKAGLYQHPEKSIFRQHPLDYIEAMTACVKEAAAQLTGEQISGIAGIGFDTTGSTPVPVNRAGVPLALTEMYKENENAMFHLWKDHSSYKEAEEINHAFRDGTTDYGMFQGDYSAEWYWAKILHSIRVEPQLREDAWMWVEHCDWMTGLLCGKTAPEELYHSACAAGHKAYWNSAWNGLPDKAVLETIDSYLADICERYGKEPEPAMIPVGQITKEWAEKLGIPDTVMVSGCSFDAHAGAVGAGILPETLVCTMGTSAVDMVVVKADEIRGKDISAFGGQAEDSILPGYIGIETGQAAFGDIFAWLVKTLLWPFGNVETKQSELMSEAGKLVEKNIFEILEKEAAALPYDNFPISLDWFNGRRYPNTDDFQKGLVSGLTLGTTPPVLYRSLVFGAVCGLKRICDGFEQAGIVIRQVRAVGGISKKSRYIMQMMADMLDKEVQILDSDQTCALGAAMYAAVGSGCYQNAEDTAANMSAKTVGVYHPNKEVQEFYQKKYQEYLKLAELADQYHPSV